MTPSFRNVSILALLVSAAPFAAKADQISFSSGSGAVAYCVSGNCPSPYAGSPNAAAGEVDFVPILAPNAQVSNFGATGIFSPFAGAAATFYNFNYIADPSNFELFSVTVPNPNGPGTSTLTYTVTNSTATVVSTVGATCMTTDCLTVTGSGTYTITTNGVSQTYTGSDLFTLTAQGGGDGTASADPRGGSGYVTFSDTNLLTPTPEPSSLMLMGTGLMSMGAFVLRRRRQGNTADVLA